ncbi:hypothetical protein LSTR_LSTR003909 [Laodelphax striatellus]|uniref:Uncharacterized protein n=1 Tax=Laodelphax striatellus TaxID=195883 RepID=A0A482XAG3_LAOST|nr:hypothetical protein LSTR_LSTR003909 [Laodelphax striatellus]
MCCVQAERVFPASDSEEGEEGGSRGSEPPLWAPRCRHHLLPARRSFSSSLVAELSAAAPRPSSCDFLDRYLEFCSERERDRKGERDSVSECDGRRDREGVTGDSNSIFLSGKTLRSIISGKVALCQEDPLDYKSPALAAQFIRREELDTFVL